MLDEVLRSHGKQLRIGRDVRDAVVEQDRRTLGEQPEGPNVTPVSLRTDIAMSVPTPLKRARALSLCAQRQTRLRAAALVLARVR